MERLDLGDSLLTAPLRVLNPGEKNYALSTSSQGGIIDLREKLSELDPGMGGESPRKLDHLLESGSAIVSLDIALTKACNFKCAHCYRPDGEWGNEGFDFGLITKLVDDALDLGVRFFVLTGGEPMMYFSRQRGDLKDYFDVVDEIQAKARAKGAEAKILTFSDVALITAEKAKMLADRRVALCLKKDTLDHAVQDAILQVGGGSEKMLRGYENLFAAGYGQNNDLAVSVNQVLRFDNIDTYSEVLDLHLWVREHGMEHSIVPIHYCGKAEGDQQSRGINPLHIKALYDLLAEIDETRFNDPWEVFSPFPKNKTCNRPGRGVHTRATGDVTSCSESPLIEPYIFGNIFSGNLAEMVQSPKFQQFREEFAKREGTYICNPNACDLSGNNLCRGGCATRSAYTRVDPRTLLPETNENTLAYTEGREDPFCPAWAVLAQRQGVLKEGIYERVVGYLLENSKRLSSGEKTALRAKVVTDFTALKNTLPPK